MADRFVYLRHEQQKVGGPVKLIILGAGYATRLYPLTLNQPKPLLEVAGKPMIEHVLDNLKAITDIDHVYIVTNARFAEHFEAWADEYQDPHPGAPVTIIDDRSTDDSNKLGAIGDVNLVLTDAQIDDDIIVVAGDNLFSSRLENFGEFCRADEIKKYNAIEINDADQITFFEEKPAHPKSTLTGIALYYYPKWALPLIRQYLAEGNHADQPGLLVQWLYPRTPFFVWRVPGIWFDVGSRETLDEANRIFLDLTLVD
ncbi:MAG: nucleoside-diphosphate-sugar pyrophosphorylase [Acidobacteria bacterium]|nr:MAG: nucleoside-diphosphate-sugar pyrophosphorylase [Acidobacteriota bacterium]